MSMHPTRNYFAEYRNGNNYFVETGTWRGDAIQLAMDAGHKEIRSIDIDSSCTDFCISRFNMHGKRRVVKMTEEGIRTIRLYVGDSAFCLSHMIADIREPITFWLDSHWQMLEGTGCGENPFPLLKELEQIAAHPIKEHTILIDDMLIMQDNIVGYNEHSIIGMLHEINKYYMFERLPNPVINNILVAHVPF